MSRFNSPQKTDLKNRGSEKIRSSDFGKFLFRFGKKYIRRAIRTDLQQNIWKTSLTLGLRYPKKGILGLRNPQPKIYRKNGFEKPGQNICTVSEPAETPLLFFLTIFLQPQVIDIQIVSRYKIRFLIVFCQFHFCEK